MKTMACPQCGALIKKISLKEKFAECDYCEARILLEDNRDRIVDVPDQPIAPPPSPWKQYRENYESANQRAQQFDSLEYAPEPSRPTILTPLIFGCAALIAGIFIFAALMNSRPSRTEAVVPTTTKLKEPTPLPITLFKTPTPAPAVNYQVKVQWSGANDMEQFENPQIDMSKLPTTDENELKKTVFKNRAVQVRITIGTDGDVTSAEAVSGHPILAEAAVAAAKKTLFNSRAKPATRVLTYYFRLLSD